MKKQTLLHLICYCLCTAVYCQDYEKIEPLIFDAMDAGERYQVVNKDSAYFYFEEADKLAKSVASIEDRLWALSFLLRTSDYHFDLQKSAEILTLTDSILSSKHSEKQLKNYDDYYEQYLANQGNYYYKLGLFNEAKNTFLQVRKRYTAKPKADLNYSEAETLFQHNNFLGTIYKRMGKYELSEAYYEENLNLIQENLSLNQYKEAFQTNVNQLVAQLYLKIDQPQKAIPLFKDGITVYKRYYKRDKKFKNNLVNAYQGITQNYISQDSLSQALLYLNESQQFLLPDDPFYKRSLLIYGDIYAQLDQSDQALKQYDKALEFYTTYRQNGPHQDIAQVYSKMAEVYLKDGSYEPGIHLINKAMTFASKDSIAITSPKGNPNPIQVFSKRQLLGLLDIKAQLYYLAYQKTGNEKHLRAVLELNSDILSTFDVLKKEFDSKLDKQFLAKNAYPIFHRMLDATYTAYQKNPSKEVLQLALQITEENKDFLLLEALRSANTSQYGKVPQELLRKEIRYRAEISNLEKQQFDSNTENTDISNALFRKKQSYYDLLDTLKLKYPQYHSLKYGTEKVALSDFKKALLDDNETLISYTMGADFLYAIVIDQSNEAFVKMPFTTADRLEVRNFYKLLSSPSISKTQNELLLLGEGLYKKILKEPLKNFESKKLTIIADDVLHYLPFDMLVANGSYLLFDKNISYGNSLTSLLELTRKKPSVQNSLLAFAPKFDGLAVQENPAAQTRQLGSLLYNGDEVNNISAFFKVDAFLNDQATLKAFKNNAGAAKIIHLATHATANDDFPDYSYLAFSETMKANENYILYIKDIYNMQLQADMVTLSACQTGIGKLQKGQGMLSLSKGFYYAGAKSLVNTLWKINDKSTVKLMKYFYEGLSAGKSKPEALRHAKLKYLETTDDVLLKHPYYWAAFVVSGDTSPLESNNFWWLLLITSAVVFIPAVYFLKRKISA